MQISYKKTNVAEKCPESLRFWDKKRNGDLTPQQVSCGSTREVWWICEKGHSWQAQVNTFSNGHRCPYCSNRKVLRGYNDLATTHPHLI